MILNGKEYPAPEIKKHSDLVRYEAQGIKIMALADGSFYDPVNIATSIVRGISYFTGLSFEEALNETDSHLDSGNSLDELLEELLKDTEKMKENGAIEGFSKGVKTPQDHKKPKTVKK